MDSREIQGEGEVSCRFAVFHVKQNGESGYFLSEGRTEFLQAAHKLRMYLKGGGLRFADDIPNRCAISAEQCGQYVSERMENTGRVTGAFDIDLDKGEFTALHIMDGWKTFRVKNVTAAVCYAMRKEQLPEQEQLEIFLEHLDGRELTANTPKPIEVQGTRRLLPEDITFGESIEEVYGILDFYLECWFPVDQVFGTHVETDANDNYLNVYAKYTGAWQGRILWQRISAILTTNTRKTVAHASETTALPPPLKPSAVAGIPVPLPVVAQEYAATNTGQLTLF